MCARLSIAALLVALVGPGAGTSARADPTLVVSRSSIDFGAQLIKHPAVTRSFQITNAGMATLSVTGSTLTGPDAASFSLVPPFAGPLLLAPQATQTLVIAYTPADLTDDHAAVTIESNDPAQPTAMVSLHGVGVARALAVSPTSIDFGNLEVPGYTSRQLTLSNALNDPIRLLEADVSGAAPGAFTLDPVAGTLGPGQSRMLSVLLRVVSIGGYAATVTFRPADTTLPPATVELSGHGGSRFRVEPSSLVFGDVGVGGSSLRTLTVTNKGERYIEVKSVSLDNPTFSIVGDLPPISPGAAINVNLVFRPAGVGVANARILLAIGTGMTQTTEVDASGNGVPPPFPGTTPPGCSLGRAAPVEGGRSGDATWPGLALFLALGLGRRRKLAHRDASTRRDATPGHPR